jgi:ABC-2 type transport system ATP-binding protein
MNKLSLCIKNVQKSFRKKQVLTNATFTVSQGECVGIIGMNGSGKTTLFNILSGEIRANSGDVLISGPDGDISLINNKKAIRKHIGYIPQENVLIGDLTTLDNLKLWYCDSKLDMNKELNDGVLHMLGIDTFLHTKVHKLSGGMQKRLSIGTALATMPDFLILDEPGAALDLVAKDIIRNYLRSFKSTGGVVIATHDEDDLDICDRLFVLKDGILKEIPPTIRGGELIKTIL